MQSPEVIKNLLDRDVTVKECEKILKCFLANLYLELGSDCRNDLDIFNNCGKMIAATTIQMEELFLSSDVDIKYHGIEEITDSMIEIAKNFRSYNESRLFYGSIKSFKPQYRNTLNLINQTKQRESVIE
jgi:hypothetical protein